MAPALVETPSQDSFNPISKEVSGVGQYKEAYIGGPKAFQKDVELRGSSTQPAARYPNYLPVWNPDKSERPSRFCA
jgi:sulfonate dioxygenase